MPMEIDHITLGRALSRSRSKCIKLIVAVSAAYPHKVPILHALIALHPDIDDLLGELNSIYHSEVNSAEFNKLGNPYDRLCDQDRAEINIGIADYRPRIRNRKPHFSDEEIVAARRCLIEIEESLEYAKGLFSKYGSQHPVHAALKSVRVRNDRAVSCFELLPAPSPQ